MHDYEIEIKSLLGSKGNAEKLLSKMRELDPKLVSHGQHKQLNHYFEDGDLKILYRNVVKHVKENDQKKLKDICDKAQDFSLRTRQADDRVLLVLKASVDDTTSENGTARIEFESRVDLTLNELDKLVLNSGFTYQAKWSRERQEFKYKDANVTIDKNAGYGYLAEFELVENDDSVLDNAKARLRELMQELGVEELRQDQLQRMFDYYNANWQDYYGTDKVFNIE
jgi:predicted adenylyl cyclase CyaB